MSAAEQPGTENRRQSPHLNDICKEFRSGLEFLVDSFVPPESACQHFREARIEMLRGLRAIIDHRIDRLSRDKKSSASARVVVE